MPTKSHGIARDSKVSICVNTENAENLYVRVKDMAGNDFVCPLNELRDSNGLSDAELENCVEDAVVGRYAGQLKIVDRAT